MKKTGKLYYGNLFPREKERKSNELEANRDCPSFRQQFGQGLLSDVVSHIGYHDLLLSLIKMRKED